MYICSPMAELRVRTGALLPLGKGLHLFWSFDHKDFKTSQTIRGCRSTSLHSVILGVLWLSVTGLRSINVTPSSSLTIPLFWAHFGFQLLACVASV
jgi:hypothetical protein